MSWNGAKAEHDFVNVLAVRELAGRPGVIDGLRWRRRRSTQHLGKQTVASLMSTALLAVSRVRFRSLARIRRCASASARSGWVSSSW